MKLSTRNIVLAVLLVVVVAFGWLTTYYAEERAKAAEEYSDAKLAEMIGENEVLVEEEFERFCEPRNWLDSLLRLRDCIADKTVYIAVDGENIREDFYNRATENGWWVLDRGELTGEFGFIEPGHLLAETNDASDGERTFESDLNISIVDQEGVDAMENFLDEDKFNILDEAAKPLIQINISTEYEG